MSSTPLTRYFRRLLPIHTSVSKASTLRSCSSSPSLLLSSMSPPAFGDLRAEYFWTLHKDPYGRMMAALPTILTEEKAWVSWEQHEVSPYHFPFPALSDPKRSLLRLAGHAPKLLLRSFYRGCHYSRPPGLPTPGLDAVWLAKGVRGTRDDLRAYWETERLRDLKEKARDAGNAAAEATS